jgi:hypothetical protein
LVQPLTETGLRNLGAGTKHLITPGPAGSFASETVENGEHHVLSSKLENDGVKVVITVRVHKHHPI